MGATGVFSAAEVTLGRHPSSQFAFDPERDLAVSVQHARIVRQGARWLVRDLGSSNGTLVNGHRIRGDTHLDDTDQIRLGADGPTLEVRLVPDSTPDRAPPATSAPAPAPAPRERPAGPSGPPPRPAPPPPRRSSITQQIRVEVGRQTRRLRVLIGVLVVTLLGGAAYVVWDSRAQSAERDRERAALQARIDSILQASAGALTQLRGEAEGLAEALRRSQQEMGDLQARLRSAEAGGRRDEVDRLRGRLASAAQALTTQQAAALVDYRAIYDANHRAIALIWAEFGPGDVQMGTAFAVRQDGMLVTNRHVVQGSQGDRRPLRVAIQFTHSDQVWPATLVGSSAEADVAVVRVDGIRGAVPAIAVPPSAPPLRPGDPVATIGFPFGTDLPMRSSGEGNVVRATLTAGLVSKVLPDEVQIDGYGAQGASGSPVFDREGRLVGVLYGGEAGTNGRIVYLVPVNSVTTLLRRLGVSSPG
jgi:S1-C subfamily serine protease